MEPRIQYAKTKDGVSIAFWTLGEGMPFVVMPPIPYGHIEMEWQIRELQRWYEMLAEKKRKVVRYDRRGTGLSDRDVTDYSLDAQVLDLEAVVDRLGLERFALFGFVNLGPVAIAYAARHQERVSHLLLWCTWARASDARWPDLRALSRLMHTNWEVYTETVAHWSVGWSEGEQARPLAAVTRESVTPEVVRASSRAFWEFDVMRLLPQVRSPSLVLHRREVVWPKVDVKKGLAALIPDARLALLEGDSWLPWLGDMESVLSAIDEFLEEGEALDHLELAGRPSQLAPVYPAGLTPRQLEVLRLIAAGKSNKEIAEELFISPNTVLRHVSNIFAKTGVANRAEAATYAARHRLVE